MKRGQGAVEVLILLGVGLAVLLLIITSSSTNLTVQQSKFRLDQARDSVDTLQSSAIFVYQQGDGAKTQVQVTLPSAINYTLVSGKTITIALDDGSVVYRNLEFNVSGEVPSISGTHQMDVKSIGGVVYITQNLSLYEQESDNQESGLTCGDNVCDSGENCPVDVVSCTDNVCYTSTCTNGCGEIAITNAEDSGECDSLTVTGSCVDAPCICDTSSTCVDVTPAVNRYVDIWSMDGNYPIDFSNGLNYTVNTFWYIGLNDGWDWKNDSIFGHPVSLDNCVSFANTSRLEISIGDANCSSLDNKGQGSGSFGIEFYVSSDQYELIENGSVVNLSFAYTYEPMPNDLDSGEEIWIKATLGNGTIFAYENWESRVIDSDYKWEGGLGFLNGWYTEGGRTDVGGEYYSGKYALELKGHSTPPYVDRRIDLSLATNPQVSFWAKANSLESSDFMYFKVSPDDSTWYTLETWTDGDEEDDTWRKYVFDVSSYYENSSTFYIAFDGEGFGNSNDKFNLDELFVYEGNVSYLGEDLDSGNQADIYREIYWDGNPDSSTISDFVNYDVSTFIQSVGWYYLTLDAIVYQWNTNNEGAHFYFEDVQIYIEE